MPQGSENREPTPEERLARLRALAATEDGTAVAAEVAPFLEDEWPLLRREAMEALGRWKRWDLLARGLADPDPDLRVHAVDLMESAPEALEPAVRSRDLLVRRQALAGLLKHDPGVAAPLLTRYLGDPLPELRRRVARLALTWAGEVLDRITPVLREIAVEDPVWWPLVERLSAESLVLLLSASLKPVRERSRARLAGLSWREAVARRLGTAEDRETRLLLEFMAERDGTKTIAAYLRHERAVVRRQAAHLLSDQDVACLVAGLDDPDLEMRRLCAARVVTAKCVGQDHAAQLVERLQDRAPAGKERWDAAIRAQIATLVGSFGWPEMVPALDQTAREDHAVAARAAADGLARMGAIDVLADLAETHEPSVLRIVAFELGKRQDRRAILPLVRAAVECRGADRHAKRLLNAFPEVRTLEFLLGLFKTPYGSAKQFAAEALEKETDPRIIEPLLAAIATETSLVQVVCVRALAKFASRTEVARALLGLLEGTELHVRQEAVVALGLGRVREAVPELIRLLGNPFLRRYAEAALKMIGDRKGYLAVLRRKRREDQIGREKERWQKRVEAARARARAGKEPVGHGAAR